VKDVRSISEKRPISYTPGGGRKKTIVILCTSEERSRKNSSSAGKMEEVVTVGGAWRDASKIFLEDEIMIYTPNRLRGGRGALLKKKKGRRGKTFRQQKEKPECAGISDRRGERRKKEISAAFHWAPRLPGEKRGDEEKTRHLPEGRGETSTLRKGSIVSMIKQGGKKIAHHFAKEGKKSNRNFCR